ncbi:MAG: type IX secretion system membrane protein PorP/SprF [Saprospirales bacterium]|nr:MAG: type IX secretion system membrane protein PorP/SprF [Saprospirales bacterium]
MVCMYQPDYCPQLLPCSIQFNICKNLYLSSIKRIIMQLAYLKISVSIFAMWFASNVLLHAQDPFFNQFFHNESSFNPSLVGYKGGFGFQAAFKNQWEASDVRAFRSGRFSLEESMPCSVFDYGINMGFNEEGEGILRRVDLGFRFAGTIPFSVGDAWHNIRIGAGLQWSQNSIDFSRLTFSDQLDPKYGLFNRMGIVNPTSFVPPNEGYSNWFLTPSAGISHRILLDHTNPRSGTILYGLAFHNAFSLNSGNLTGNEESILGTGEKIPPRFSLFATYEFIPWMNNRQFLAVRPLLVTELQSKISYLQAGFRTSFNRFLAAGVYYHTNRRPEEGVNTSWMTFKVEFGWTIPNGARVELGLAYSSNLSGLRNYLNNTIEMSMGVYFPISPSCNLAGKSDQVPYGSHTRCVTSLITPGRYKMYESIWTP